MTTDLKESLLRLPVGRSMTMTVFSARDEQRMKSIATRINREGAPDHRDGFLSCAVTGPDILTITRHASQREALLARGQRKKPGPSTTKPTSKPQRATPPPDKWGLNALHTQRELFVPSHRHQTRSIQAAAHSKAAHFGWRIATERSPKGGVLITRLDLPQENQP